MLEKEKQKIFDAEKDRALLNARYVQNCKYKSAMPRFNVYELEWMTKTLVNLFNVISEHQAICTEDSSCPICRT